MNYLTHTTGGVGAGLMASAFLFPDMSPADIPISGALMAGAVFGSLLPDIDHGKSYISNNAPVIGFMVSSIFKHRGVIHTPIFNLALTIALFILAKMLCPEGFIDYAHYSTLGIGMGYFSHIALDTCNVQGILWLFPFSKKRFHILGITTGSFAEKLFAAAMVAGIVWYFPPEYVQFAERYLLK